MNARSIVERLYAIGEAVTGSHEAQKLAEEIRSILGETLGVDPRFVKLPVLTWRDKGAVVRCGQLEFSGATLPQTLGGVAEGRLVEVHCTDPTCFNHVKPGDVVVARLPEDPDDATTLYVNALMAGASALIIYDSRGEYLRRIVVSGRQDYALLPSPAPMPAVYLRRGHGRSLVKQCTGVRVTVESRVEAGESTGRIVEAIVEGENDWEVLLVAHYDHWLGGSGDNLAGVASLIQALEALRREGLGKAWLRVAVLDAEEFGDPTMPAWYWSYGSRWYARRLRDAGLLENIVAVVNLDLPVRRRLHVAATPELHKLARDALDGLPVEPVYEESETCYSDGYQFAILGVPSATLYNIDDYLDYYHTDADAPDKPDYTAVEAAAKATARIAKSLLENGPRALDYLGYARMLYEEVEGPVEWRRAAYMLLEETRLALERGDYENLQRAYSIVTSRLSACVYHGDYLWDTGPFKSTLAPRLRSVTRLVEEARAVKRRGWRAVLEELPGDRVVPGSEEKLPTLTPTPVRRWLELGGEPPRLLNELLDVAVRSLLHELTLEDANVLLEAYEVLRGARREA